MWRLPERAVDEVAEWPLLHERKYSITRYRVTMRVHRAGEVVPGEGEIWQPVAGLSELVVPPADRAALEAVLDDQSGMEEIA